MTTDAVPLTVTCQGAAALCAVSYDWLQRHWRRLVDEEGFPTPYIGSRPGERPRWLREFVVRWMEARSAGGALPDFDISQPHAPAKPAIDAGAYPVSADIDEISALVAAAGGR